jgi:predicted Zn-dependent protease
MTIHNVGLVRPVMLFALCLASIGCATTDLPPLEGSQARLVLSEDESRTWKTAEELENKIGKAGILYQNPGLENYLNSTAEKLVPEPILPKGVRIRVKVIQSPFLNAMALPNGTIYLHTGILARIDNEAQLATILGHELVHFTHRHAIQEIRGAESKSAIARATQITLTIVSGRLGYLIGEAADVWALASVRGYSRELETEADTVGLKLLVMAGYDPKEAPQVFEHLRSELDQAVKEPFFFGTHPQLQERIDNYRALLQTRYSQEASEVGRISNATQFFDQTAQLLLDNAVLDLDIRRFKTARAAIDKHLRRRPSTAHAYFLLGEVHRRSGASEASVAEATAAYQEAVRRDPSYADPHRELGLLFRKQNHNEEARTEFEQYLRLNPHAVDKPIILGYLTEPARPP